ncbi:hypothetical protein SteCoe_22810 [Stentor coeruleus]|uniref:Cache domain-containing protein n=1 Tax=Stentor coeruleus TaxID=5963 RepID=A0A1R2BLC1_9CILI|nr:hypothetical protein SteCoe_22810 [Stentor coeruleus]
MKCNAFGKLSISTQFQIGTISSGFLICLILFLITKYQLDWLKLLITNETEKSFEDKVFDDLKNIGHLQKAYLESEFEKFINFEKQKHDITTIMLSFSKDYEFKSPLPQNDRLWYTSIQPGVFNYTQPSYMSSLGIQAGEELMKNVSCMDPIYKRIYSSDYWYLYEGYYESQIFHVFPGVRSDSKYTPLIREWFYKAKAAQYHQIITEPYISASLKQWMFSVAESINEPSGKFIGVSTIDILLKSLAYKITQIRIMKYGFIMLISKGGMILTKPYRWENPNVIDSIRIYNKTYSGIDKNEWETIKNLTLNEKYYITDANGDKLLIARFAVQPFNNNITHYLIICADYDEINEASNIVERNFNKAYNAAFLVALIFSIVIFTSISLLIYVPMKEVGYQFKIIQKIFKTICSLGIYPNKSYNKSLSKLQKHSKGIKSLADSCQKKYWDHYSIETNFAAFMWGLTRPRDDLIYKELESKLYPYSSSPKLLNSIKPLLKNLEFIE